MKETKNNEEKIQEFHILEQNLQNLLLQKQTFQMELSETTTAKKEIEKSEEVFKVIGQLMIKSSPSEMKEELSNRENLLNIRLKSIEKQENHLTEKLEALRKEIF